MLSSVWIALVVVSCFTPPKEWPAARKIGQLWYEIFDFHCNLSPEERAKNICDGENTQFIIGMHPHGIIPLQAILWTSYCDQYLKDGNGEMYGFGAAADVVQYVPFLRNVMAWLTAGGASKKVLVDGLMHGKSAAANALGRKPRHLFILPGGIAEIFTSDPGKHAIVFKDRRGLIKISIQTGAQLLPTYVFGGTDFFHSFIHYKSFISDLARKYKIGLTFFWGQYFSPLIPYAPKVSLCIGPPIAVTKWHGSPEDIPEAMIDALHKQVCMCSIKL